VDQSLKQVASAMRTFAIYHLIECLKPFADFFFGINFSVQREFQDPTINLVCGHCYLNNLRKANEGDRRRCVIPQTTRCASGLFRFWCLLIEMLTQTNRFLPVSGSALRMSHSSQRNAIASSCPRDGHRLTYGSAIPTPVENDRRQRVGSCGDASLMNVRSILAVNERTVSASEAVHDGNNAAAFWDASNEKRAAFTARHQDQITQNRTRSFVSISNRDRQSRCGCD
jgi:hypothetical protein